MIQILVLVADPTRHALGPADLASLPAMGPAVWLSPGKAVELPVGPDVSANSVREILGEAPVDFALVPREGRRKRLLLADMDSTIITVECLDELAGFAGMKPQIAAITERAMRGELDFTAALRERVAMLAGLEETALSRTYVERVTLTPGARTLVMTMRRSGAYAALVSGGFTYFTSRVREAAGFDIDLANRLVIDAGKLSGRVHEPILDSAVKLSTLRRLAAERGLGREETLAVGDGANDLPMLQAAGLGVAYHAKPLVAAAAHARVEHGDLTALLYFQGYRDAEFVTD